MPSCPSPPRNDASSPPHPLIRYEDQAHDLESGAWSIARNSKPASSHTPHRSGPQSSAPGRTNLAVRSSTPSVRSVSHPVTQNDKLCGGTEDDHDVVVRPALEPESLRSRYSSARQAIAKVMSIFRAILLGSQRTLSRESTPRQMCGTFWTSRAAAWSSQMASFSQQLSRQIRVHDPGNRKFRLHSGRFAGMKAARTCRVGHGD